MSVEAITDTTTQTAVQKRTEKLAHQAGEDAASRVHNALREYGDVVTPEQIEAIKAKKYTLAFEAMKRAREDGRHFDMYSSAPGVRVIMTEIACDHLLDLFARQQDLGQYSGNIRALDISEGLYELRLDAGTFFVAFGECQMHGHVTYDGKTFDKVSDPFIIPIDEVLRIEGDSGEVWQNTSFDFEEFSKEL